MPRDQIEAGGEKLYRVDVTETRTAVFYVLAEDQAAAEADAKVLGHELDEWDDYDTDIDIAPARKEPADDEMVWTGGEKGRYWEWEEIGESVPADEEAEEPQ